MTKMEFADGLFSRAGFIGRIVPAILFHCASIVGIGLFTLSRTAPETDPVWICVALCCFVASVDLIRYSMAAAKHRNLKSCFGQRYIDLVDEGVIPLNAHAVLLLGSPGTFARRLLPE
jgi:hypothetical protein